MMVARDTATGYGWLSITLHWLGAALVLTLWFIGSSISSAGQRSIETLRLHTSIAIVAWLLLWFRIAWRLRRGHPGPLDRQRGWAFSVGKVLHFLLLALLAVMLLTGPLSLWLKSDDIHVFSFSISSPFDVHMGAARVMRDVHGTTANLLFLATLLHIGGTLKHVAWNKDGTLEKMLVAPSIENEGDGG